MTVAVFDTSFALTHFGFALLYQATVLICVLLPSIKGCLDAPDVSSLGLIIVYCHVSQVAFLLSASPLR